MPAKPYHFQIMEKGRQEYRVIADGVVLGYVHRGGCTPEGRFGGWSARTLSDRKTLGYAPSRSEAGAWVYAMSAFDPEVEIFPVDDES